MNNFVAGTYSQIYIQVVFAVKGRSNLIRPAWSGINITNREILSESEDLYRFPIVASFPHTSSKVFTNNSFNNSDFGRGVLSIVLTKLL